LREKPMVAGIFKTANTRSASSVGERAKDGSPGGVEKMAVFATMPSANARIATG